MINIYSKFFQEQRKVPIQSRVIYLKGMRISQATGGRERYSSQQDNSEIRNSPGKEGRVGFQIMYKRIRSSGLLEPKGVGEWGRLKLEK